MPPHAAGTPNRSRWMRAGRECMATGDWAGAIRAYGQGRMEQPLQGRHYASTIRGQPTTRWWRRPSSATTPPAAPSRCYSCISTWSIRWRCSAGISPGGGDWGDSG